MNIIPATVREAGEATNIALQDGAMVRLPIRTDAAEAGKAVSFGVRPEDLEVSDSEEFLFEGRISMVEALGEVTLLYIGGPGGQEPIIAKIPGIFSASKGDVVRLSAPPQKLHLFDVEGNAYRR